MSRDDAYGWVVVTEARAIPHNRTAEGAKAEQSFVRNSLSLTVRVSGLILESRMGKEGNLASRATSEWRLTSRCLVRVKGSGRTYGAVGRAEMKSRLRRRQSRNV